jgi:hypothetical protein
MHGHGKLSVPAPNQDEGDSLQLVYEGQFDQGKKQGRGKVHIEGGTYSFESTFNNNEPDYLAN